MQLMVDSRHHSDCHCAAGLEVACYRETLQQSLQLIIIFEHSPGSQHQQTLLGNCHCVRQIARCRGSLVPVAMITAVIVIALAMG